MLRFRVSLWACLTCAALSAFVAVPAQAQVSPGAQAGASITPDQFFFGGHVETTPVYDKVRFRPGVDVGFGEDLTLVAINFDFTYSFTETRPWNLYAGGGPGINWFNVDGPGSETEAGLNFLVGVKHRDGLFFEMRVGAFDSPDLKFGVGYTFR